MTGEVLAQAPPRWPRRSLAGDPELAVHPGLRQALSEQAPADAAA